MAVLSRFEALQTFLSTDEQESVKSALFGSTQANAETNEARTDTDKADGSGGSAHLERSVAEISWSH